VDDVYEADPDMAKIGWGGNWARRTSCDILESVYGIGRML
jgi:hypothetical protein